MTSIIDWINGWTLNGKLSILFFLFSSGLVFVCAWQLVRFADVIMSKTRFGGGFVGGALVAAATSLPELITEIAQSTSGHPGVSNADDIGSNAFTTFLIALGAILFLRLQFLNKLTRWTKITIWISFGLALSLTLLAYFKHDLHLGKAGTFVIGIIPMSLFIFYLFSLWLQYKFAKDEEGKMELREKDRHMSAKKGVLGFLFWALLLTGSALLMNWFASSTADGYSLGPDSIGGILLSVATSLPEVVAFFILLKKSKPIAAVSAMIGSHLFNLALSFVGDMAYVDAPIFTHEEVHQNWVISALTAVLLLLLGLHVLFSKKLNKKGYYLIIPSLVVAGYVVGWVLILTLSH